MLKNILMDFCIGKQYMQDSHPNYTVIKEDHERSNISILDLRDCLFLPI